MFAKIYPKQWCRGKVKLLIQGLVGCQHTQNDPETSTLLIHLSIVRHSKATHSSQWTAFPLLGRYILFWAVRERPAPCRILKWNRHVSHRDDGTSHRPRVPYCVTSSHRDGRENPLTPALINRISGSKTTEGMEELRRRFRATDVKPEIKVGPVLSPGTSIASYSLCSHSSILWRR